MATEILQAQELCTYHLNTWSWSWRRRRPIELVKEMTVVMLPIGRREEQRRSCGKVGCADEKGGRWCRVFVACLWRILYLVLLSSEERMLVLIFLH